ncbi:hypothetical protein E2C01_007498 [Portunus trituberculatus]|uniref:Uncharacterized protein n=1 Tax=Portunus trituberculatus TaxID=210409 RepID=A0A5B7D2K4_PORTR|nr:hypothetical protein [Portunus trituberculatus]
MITVSVSETHLCAERITEILVSTASSWKSVLQPAKHSFINRKCQNLSKFNSP